jgi:hypothetical protein
MANLKAMKEKHGALKTMVKTLEKATRAKKKATLKAREYVCLSCRDRWKYYRKPKECHICGWDELLCLD